MSQLFGFPSGLSGGSKETEYNTSWDTIRNTNYTSYFNTSRNTSWTASSSSTVTMLGTNRYATLSGNWNGQGYTTLGTDGWIRVRVFVRNPTTNTEAVWEFHDNQGSIQAAAGYLSTYNHTITSIGQRSYNGFYPNWQHYVSVQITPDKVSTHSSINHTLWNGWHDYTNINSFSGDIILKTHFWVNLTTSASYSQNTTFGTQKTTNKNTTVSTGKTTSHITYG